MANKTRAKRAVMILEPAVQVVDHGPEFTWELGSDILSGEAGNGKASLFRLVDGRLEHVLLPTARTRLRESSLNKEVTSIDSAQITKVEFMGTLYGVGDEIWNLSDYPVETFSNSEMRYGSEHHIFMILTTFALLGVESGEVTLVTSAPPGLINQVAGRIKEAFRAGDSGLGDSTWHIKMDGKERTYVIKKVMAIAEGIGAYAAYAYDANGSNVALPHPITGVDMLTGIVSINDAGMGTFDQFTIHNGQLNLQSIEHATDNEGGIQTHLIQPLMDYIHTEFRRAEHPQVSLNQAQADSWLRAWANGGFKPEAANFTVSGLKLNIHTIATRLCQQYARWIIQEKLEPAFRRGADTVLLAGGGWVYMLAEILKAYPKRNILYPEIVPHLKGIPLWDLNAYGGLPLVANNKRVFRNVKG